jgi:predicted nucleotidyltransferase
MPNVIEENLGQIQHILRHFGVERAYAFGSAVKGNMHKQSDIDFIIRFPETMQFKAYSDNYFGLAHALEDLLKREVDLVAEETLSNPYLIESIDSHKVRLL